MKIKPTCVVALTWILKDTLGEELDVLEQPVEFMLGGEDLLEPIEQALLGREAGAEIEIQIEPEQGFGDYDDQLVFLEARSLFPVALEEGVILDGQALPAACSADLPRHGSYTVTEIYPEHVVLDGNHPLAGLALRLRLKVQAVRDASTEELEQGSVGPGFFRRASPPATVPGNRTLH